MGHLRALPKQQITMLLRDEFACAWLLHFLLAQAPACSLRSPWQGACETANHHATA